MDILKEYYNLMYQKYIDSELGKQYDTETFYGEKHRIQTIMDINGIPFKKIDEERIKAEKDAYNYLKG